MITDPVMLDVDTLEISPPHRPAEEQPPSLGPEA